MSVFDLFRPVRVTDRVHAHSLAPLVTPNQTSTLPMVVYSEFFAGEVAEVTRYGALQIPAFKRARDLLTSTIAGTSLHQYRDGEDVTPDWLTNSTSGVSPYHRMLAIVDDLLFYDWSLLAVQRGTSGQITDALRVPFEQWAVDDLSGRISVQDKQVSAEEVILIPGNGSGGVLQTGAQTIKGYRAMERAWVGRVQNPIPLVELHQTTEDPLTDGTVDDEENEIARLTSDWAAARMSPTGAVGYTPHNIELRVHGDVKHELFVEGRNASVLDIARLFGIPGSLLDGSMATATLTYSTTEGKRSEFDMYTTPLYLDPIEARLSLDDVAPAGEVIRFDRSARASVEAPALREPLND